MEGFPVIVGKRCSLIIVVVIKQSTLRRYNMVAPIVRVIGHSDVKL